MAENNASQEVCKIFKARLQTCKPLANLAETQGNPRFSGLQTCCKPLADLANLPESEEIRGFLTTAEERIAGGDRSLEEVGVILSGRENL